MGWASMAIVKFGKNKGKQAKAKKAAQVMEEENHGLVVPEAYRERCKLELSSYRTMESHTDLRGWIQTTANAFIAGVLDLKQASTIGYLVSIQNQVLRYSKAEGSPTAGLDERLLEGDVDLTAQQTDLEELTRATTRDIQIRMVNKIVTKTLSYEKVSIPKETEKEVSGPLKNTLRQIDVIEVEEVE
jgi:hypothetical protein